MTDKTKNIIQKVSLGMVVIGSIGAILTGVAPADVSIGVTIAEGVIACVGGVISYIFGKK